MPRRRARVAAVPLKQPAPAAGQPGPGEPGTTLPHPTIPFPPFSPAPMVVPFLAESSAIKFKYSDDSLMVMFAILRWQLEPVPVSARLLHRALHGAKVKGSGAGFCVPR